MHRDSETSLEIAYATLGKLIARGNNPRLDADGLIDVGGPVLARELEWCKANREAFQSALVGAGRYVKGTLDGIYELDADSDFANEKGISGERNE